MLTADRAPHEGELAPQTGSHRQEVEQLGHCGVAVMGSHQAGARTWRRESRRVVRPDVPRRSCSLHRRAQVDYLLAKWSQLRLAHCRDLFCLAVSGRPMVLALAGRVRDSRSPRGLLTRKLGPERASVRHLAEHPLLKLTSLAGLQESQLARVSHPPSLAVMVQLPVRWALPRKEGPLLVECQAALRGIRTTLPALVSVTVSLLPIAWVWHPASIPLPARLAKTQCRKRLSKQIVAVKLDDESRKNVTQRSARWKGGRRRDCRLSVSVKQRSEKSRDNGRSVNERSVNERRARAAPKSPWRSGGAERLWLRPSGGAVRQR
mmetsp:Transcript_27805/g.73443  ORF Transcript_27805/g.73443 Transcript_27805/m.73443 type:complete len:320 (-) Transcript_27805:958-1917(-)